MGRNMVPLAPRNFQLTFPTLRGSFSSNFA